MDFDRVITQRIMTLKISDIITDKNLPLINGNLVTKYSFENRQPNLCTYHRPSPGVGGGGGKYNLVWGLYERFERLFYPGGGGNEGGLVSKSLAPRGKQGTL